MENYHNHGTAQHGRPDHAGSIGYPNPSQECVCDKYGHWREISQVRAGATRPLTNLCQVQTAVPKLRSVIVL